MSESFYYFLYTVVKEIKYILTTYSKNVKDLVILEVKNYFNYLILFTVLDTLMSFTTWIIFFVA